MTSGQQTCSRGRHHQPGSNIIQLIREGINDDNGSTTPAEQHHEVLDMLDSVWKVQQLEFRELFEIGTCFVQPHDWR